MDLRLLEGQGHLRPLQGAGLEIPLDLAVPPGPRVGTGRGTMGLET
jgi:hypothetical protein